jgi:nucleotide-binding universal stress UspA family protein
MARAINKILVCVDFHKQSRNALMDISEYAKKMQAEIVLLYVIEEAGFVSQLLRTESIMQHLRKIARKKLDEMALEIIRDKDIRVITMVDSGKVYRKILETAELINASTIIMGKTGSSGKNFPGSNTLQVIKRSPRPVLLIKENALKSTINDIVLPLDLSKETQDKVELAIEYAKLYNATIRIFSVLSVNIKKMDSLIYKKMKKVRKRIESAGIQVSMELQKEDEASISKAVVAYARKIEAGLIIIMTQQENSISRYFMGKHAQEIINISDIPVLTTIPFMNRSSLFEDLIDPLFGKTPDVKE